MKRFSAVVLVTSLAWTLALPSPPLAQPKRVVTIASGAVDGVYFPIAGLMSRIASDAKDLNVRAVVASSGGAIANVQLIRAGEADFALVQNDVAYYAFNGVALEAFAGKPVKSMAGVFTIYPELVHIVATQASGVKSIATSRASVSFSGRSARAPSRTRSRSSARTGSASRTCGSPHASPLRRRPSS